MSCSTFIITLEDGSVFTSFEQYEKHLNSIPHEEEKFPFFQILLNKECHAFCFMVPELWNLSGGSYPYHDSYTFSFFTIHDISNELTFICETICNKLHFDIIDRIEASPLPCKK